MKSLKVLCVIALLSIFSLILTCTQRLYSINNKVKQDHVFEIYTPKDIIFFNIETGKVFSESGNIDTIINNQNDLIEFIGIVTANQSDI